MMSHSRGGACAAGFAIFLLLSLSLSLHGCGAGDGSGSSGGGDYPGHGVSKSTYSCNDPVAGWTWLNKYFPVETPTDECANHICTCPASGNTQEWEIQQGRVYAKRAGASGPGGHAGNGFGLHLVNVSAHLTTGGMSTAAVEAEFSTKLGDMSTFDSFMDYNVVFSTEGLAAYKDAFNADGVKYLAGIWTGPDGTDYTSIVVQVPKTQMILELVEETSLTYSEGEAKPVALEQRVPTHSLQSMNGTAAKFGGIGARSLRSSSTSVGSIITPLVVNRAASANSMAKLEDFYVNGMGTTMTHNEDINGVVKKCFLWTGATVHVCFTQRADSATRGDWKVVDFENMLNTVHKNFMEGHPFCGMDKWEDNHYAIDSRTADTSKIIDYINTHKPYHYCATSGPSTSLHYVWDPTGWGIQLDLSFTTVPDDCATSVVTKQWLAKPRLLDHTNPACTLEPENCASQASLESVVM